MRTEEVQKDKLNEFVGIDREFRETASAVVQSIPTLHALHSRLESWMREVHTAALNDEPIVPSYLLMSAQGILIAMELRIDALLEQNQEDASDDIHRIAQEAV